MPVMGLGGSTIATLVITLPSLLGGRAASARAEQVAYISHSARVVRPTPRARPAAAATLKRLPPPALIASRPVSPHPAIRADRPTTAPTSTAEPATPTSSGDRGATKGTKPRTTPTPVASVAAAADAGTPAAIARLATTAEPVATAGPAAATSPGYVNPLAQAKVTPERIDQGVDYGGSGDLTAIGAGRVTYVSTSGTGWPGAFIEFRLDAGPDAGRYVYYAEGIVPIGGLHVGQTVEAGQKLATLIGSSGGIEIGWGAGVGTETYAMKAGQWKSGMDGDNVPTASGRSFSALIASLGGPPGKVEG